MIIRAPLLRKAYLRRRKKRDEEALKGNEADELATGDGDNGTGETGANTSRDGGGTDKALEGVGDASSEGGDNDEDSEATPADATVAMVQGAAKKAGHILSRAIDDDRMLLYFWKLLSIWFFNQASDRAGSPYRCHLFVAIESNVLPRPNAMDHHGSRHFLVTVFFSTLTSLSSS